MAINYDKLMARKFLDAEQTYTKRDTILYALGLGFGADPVDENQLQYVYEKSLKALPTMAVVLGSPGSWMREDPEVGINYLKVVHGEQSLAVHKPLPAEATVVGHNRIDRIIDKGEGKGAVVYVERKLYDKANGDHLATTMGSIFARADGGFGGPVTQAPALHQMPEGAPDVVCDIATMPRQALIYRLSGDYNPLHSDPAVAKAAGFPVPILHGLCTYGIVGHAVIKSFCGYDASRLTGLQVRFSSPIYPGETIRVEMWKSAGVVSLRAKVLERDLVVLSNGRADIQQ
ncbi:MaoC/PaaZ C-terminal domain-containing protein [Polaromonas sp. AET17H-212]|uniref:MaoC/PaaZ C-terminal domain-containing protein n=1 Tax=Polaromonas sp. AET17H-212 TaxID=1977061 RepID=UPI000BBC6AC0|nr:MaoC/PaaZ C-terminal domain-containing protein [Polaromonas sp. AET17H-212]